MVSGSGFLPGGFGPMGSSAPSQTPSFVTGGPFLSLSNPGAPPIGLPSQTTAAFPMGPTGVFSPGFLPFSGFSTFNGGDFPFSGVPNPGLGTLPSAGGSPISFNPVFNPGGFPGASAPLPAPSPSLPQTPVFSDPNKDALFQSLSKIAADPEGAVLVNEALRRGVKIHVSGFDRPDLLGLTTSVGDRSTIRVRDPNNLKTLVHELVHAVSTGDGNSQLEEGVANIIGRRVEARINQQPVTETPRATLNATIPRYPDLMSANAILDTLRRLGISVSITG